MVSFGNGKVESFNATSPMSLHAEAATRHSGLKWLVIRMGLFAENQEAAYKYAASSGVLAQPAKGSDRVPWITRHDVARGVVAATLQWELQGRTFDLEGVAAVSFDEIAGFISKIAGKQVAFKQVTPDEFAAPMVPMFGADMAKLFANMMASFNRAAAAGEFPVTNDLYELTGRNAAPFEDYLKKALTAKA